MGNPDIGVTIAVGTPEERTTIVTTINAIVTLSARDYDAVLFDLDGVLTKTAEAMAGTYPVVAMDSARSGDRGCSHAA
jgi:hypothetical protein